MANSATGLQAWEGYERHKAGQYQRLSDMMLTQEGSELVSGSVVRGILREETNKYREQRCVCLAGQAARARISIIIKRKSRTDKEKR